MVDKEGSIGEKEKTGIEKSNAAEAQLKLLKAIIEPGERNNFMNQRLITNDVNY